MSALPRLFSQILLVALLTFGTQQLGQGIWIQLKASAAQVLILNAWQQALQHGQYFKPWPWSDTAPIAKLHIPQHEVKLFVLSGAQGHSLAFGPGHLHGTALPGETGVSIIGGHRDTHFRFLQDLTIGETLHVENIFGTQRSYQLYDMQVVDSTKHELRGEREDELILITCFPFNSVTTGGNQRYIVRAHAI